MALPTALQPLTAAPRWLGWKWEQKANGDWDKPPYRVDAPGLHASSTNPNTWTSYERAVEALHAEKISGIGYALVDDAERVFIDMDKCRNLETGEIADWAMRYVEEANSYTEITPSGKGLRIIGLRGHITNPIHLPYRLPEGGTGEIFFRAARYVTVTGDRLPGTPDVLRDIADVTLDMLVLAGRRQAADSGTGAPAADFQPNPQALAPIEDVAAALGIIGNPDLHYDDWVRVGLATYAATAGSDDGYRTWLEWSARSAKHSDDECLRVWRSFHRSPPNRIGFGSLYHMAIRGRIFWTPPSWSQQQGDASQGSETTERGKAPLPLIYFSDVKPNLNAADFVRGLLVEEAMSVVYGPSNCGKTFFMTDLALHVATGRTWRKRAIEAGGVIYCALEGSHGISNRVAAFKQEHGLDGVEVPFAIVPVAINLLDPAADRAKLVETVRIAADAMGVPVKLIVVDTLSRALSGGNENAPDDMGALVASADYIRQAAKAHICFIHHSGKDQAQGARGHSLLRAATDTEIEISRQDKDSPSTAKVTKQRELEIEGEFVFRLKSVDLGKDRRGEAVTSCVVETVDGGASYSRPVRLAGAAKAAMTALSEALAKSGATTGLRDIPENVPVVPVNTWRAEFYARSTLDTQEARKKAFQRGVKDLLEARAAMVMHDRAWIVRDQPPGQGAGT